MAQADENPEIAAIRAQYHADIERERAVQEARIRAVQEEFTDNLDKLSPDEHKEFLKDLLETAKTQFRHLLTHAKSEAVQMAAIKHVFAGAYDIPEGETPLNTIEALIAKLTGSPPQDSQNSQDSQEPTPEASTTYPEEGTE